MSSSSLLSCIFVAALVTSPVTTTAADSPEVIVTLAKHRFEPAEIKVPAETKIRLVVQNQDPTAEEFESHALNREKVIPGNGKAAIFVGPLKPGRYPFFGEFNEKTAQGLLIVE